LVKCIKHRQTVINKERSNQGTPKDQILFHIIEIKSSIQKSKIEKHLKSLKNYYNFFSDDFFNIKSRIFSNQFQFIYDIEATNETKVVSHLENIPKPNELGDQDFVGTIRKKREYIEMIERIHRANLNPQNGSYFKKTEFSSKPTICKATCKNCNVIPKYTLHEIENVLGKEEITTELCLHSHHPSAANKKDVQRKELLNHYKYVHKNF
jgi:hypothetical protein